MKITHLSEAVSIKVISEDARQGVFEVEGLYSGYGLTVGNALRRALLSSLPGAAVTQFKVKGVSHEFSTLPGVKEDVIEMSLNLKQLRFRVHTDEPQVLLLSAKGETAITARDFETNAEVEIINPDAPIATLTGKSSVLELEVTVERGLGYSAVESRKREKLGIGVIALDAFFSPVTKVNYVIQDMRVGERTDYNKLHLEVETDGTLSPSSALHKASNVLRDHFEKVAQVPEQSFEITAVVKEAKKKTTKKKSA
ncbi:MAG: DNA-directed RNA polymerase subunit alpha [Patescibacteria group bacterium]